MGEAGNHTSDFALLGVWSSATALFGDAVEWCADIFVYGLRAVESIAFAAALVYYGVQELGR